MYGFSIKLAHQYYIRICCQYTLMKFLLHPVGQSFAMVKHWFHFLQPLFSTKCPKKKKSGRENWCFLKEKRFVTPMTHAPYGSHILVNFPTTTILRNKPALSARASPEGHLY